MKKISRLICALLCAALLLSASAFAAEDGFNASLTIDRSAAGQIRVTVADSSVLAAKKPTLTIPCEFAAAYVSFGGSVIASALDTEKKEISFPVAAGGTYVIQSGAAPSAAAPSAPAAEVTVPVFSAAGKVDASGGDRHSRDRFRPCDGRPAQGHRLRPGRRGSRRRRGGCLRA
jgi:hypothetical protein